ncbi:MAG: Tripartite-type tricarboxylate transporter, receptor component TctC [Betaproteobacteria bacterium]|nr:Tripartite-type tricarboxylate transporter, receptor component TctC [Betaproteobacteria bacterium]
MGSKINRGSGMNIVKGFACAAALIAGHAAAQHYPSKPVRVLVGFAAGGPTDVIARVLAQDLTRVLGQPLIIDNRTGANSRIATETVARATPDGHTLLFASLSHNVNYLLMEKKTYHPLRDFAPISLTAVLPLLLVTRPETPASSVRELIEMAKARPGAVTYGSAGNGGSAHLAGALLETLTGTKMTHVPFRGNAPALVDVMSGQVTFMFYPMIGIADHVAVKRLKVLAVGTAKRHPDYPSSPTMAESGFPGFEETAPWVGMLAPAGTPPAIVDRMSAEIRKSIAKPEVKERLAVLGAINVGSLPAEFVEYLKKDAERWARVIKAAGVKAQ